jgi:outer membrane lipoprotein-sorting protein
MTHGRLHLVVVLVLAVPLSGCLFRSRRVPAPLRPTNLKTATLAELVARIASDAASIRTLNATVDLAASSGGWSKGKVTQYQEIRGYILARKPEMLRLIGLFPVVRNRAFDMVSNGATFKLWLPTKNKFIIGRNQLARPSPKPLENLRPQHIYDALLLHPVDPKDEIAVLEHASEMSVDPKTHKPVEELEYVVDIIHRDSQGWYLSRKITFSRTDLNPHRQVLYDRNGYVATDAHYDVYLPFDGVQFPAEIQIWRPQEEYSVTLKILKLTPNQPLSDEQFALSQPAGAEVVRLDSQQGNTTSGDGNPK